MTITAPRPTVTPPAPVPPRRPSRLDGGSGATRTLISAADLNRGRGRVLYWSR